MARKKRSKKRKGTHRRRRVGAIHPAIKQTFEMVAGAALGAGGAVMINQFIKSSFTGMPGWLGGAAGVAVGGGLPMFLKPSPLVTGVAAGLAGMGAIFAVNETFLSLPGISGVPMMATPARPGYINQTVGRVQRYLGPKQSSHMGNMSGNRRLAVGNLSGKSHMAIGSIFDN